MKNRKGGVGTARRISRVCLKMDDLTLEIGFQLIPLVDEKQGGQMLNRVGLRRHLATELGFIVPPVHITEICGCTRGSIS